MYRSTPLGRSGSGSGKIRRFADGSEGKVKGGGWWAEGGVAGTIVGQGRCGGGLIEGGNVQRRNGNGHRELEVEMSRGEGEAGSGSGQKVVGKFSWWVEVEVFRGEVELSSRVVHCY